MSDDDCAAVSDTVRAVVRCSGADNECPCRLYTRASYERMDRDGAWHPVCYECVRVSRRLGWRTRRLRAPNGESNRFKMSGANLEYG